MSKVKALYHIVFCTKRRQMTISETHSEDVYRFIWNIIKESRSKLLRIGGIQNHIHLLIDLNPSIALSSLMRDIKANSSAWMKGNSCFPYFDGWAKEFYACTVSPEHKDAVIDYINGQKYHHHGIPFDNEIKNMYRYADMDYYETDLQ